MGKLGKLGGEIQFGKTSIMKIWALLVPCTTTCGLNDNALLKKRKQHADLKLWYFPCTKHVVLK